MFTGIVVEVGRVSGDPERSPDGSVRLCVTLSDGLRARCAPGDSVSVAGVCLTVAERPEGRLRFDLSRETLDRSTLGELAAGDPVNLEPALRAGDPLGGHWVQGHVDATTSVLQRVDSGDYCEMHFALPKDLSRYLVEKGSVALDGVSLTIASLAPDFFSVALIPHTLQETTFGARQEGDLINLEVDVLAKYVERQLAERFGGES